MTGPWEDFQQTPIKAQSAPLALDQSASPPGPWDDFKPKAAPSFAEAGKVMYDAEMEGRTLARQGVSPHVFSQYAPAKPKKLGDLEEFEVGREGYRGLNEKTGQIEELAVNPKTDFIATDPETGKKAVFARHTKAAGSEAETLTNEGPLVRIAREVVPGLAVGPPSGIAARAPLQFREGVNPGFMQRTFVGPRAGEIAEAPAAVAPGARPPTTVGTPTSAALATDRAASAAQDAQAFDNLGVRKFGPAFNQGPVASVAKQLTETPLVGSPLKNALDDSLRGTAAAAENVAGRYGSAATPETAGSSIREGITRFKDARPAEIVDRAAEGYSPGQLSQIIRTPARDTSLKTKQAALYQRAWNQIPEEMQAGRSVEGLPRVLGDMPNARSLLQEIEARNLRMINASADPAAAAAAAKPIAGGGLAGRMVEAMLNPSWKAALQSMRDVRSNFRRLASGVSDTEKNTMQLSDMERLQSAVTKDMISLLERNVERYAKAANQPSASLKILAENMGLPPAIASDGRAIRRHLVESARSIQRSITEFKRADTFTRASAQRMDALEKLFNAPSAEALYRNVAASALSKGRGDLEKLRVLRKTLQPDEMGDVSAAVIRQLGEPIGSARGVTQELNFSVQSFLTRWQNMSPEARTLLFGGEHEAALRDLVRVASRLANVEALANSSRSGTNALNMSGLLGSIGLGASGNWPAVLGMAGGGLAASVLMARPAYVRWATEYAALRAAALRAPVNTSAGRLTAHIQRLGSMAQKDPQLLPVYRSIAAENGVDEGSDKQQPKQ